MDRDGGRGAQREGGERRGEMLGRGGSGTGRAPPGEDSQLFGGKVNQIIFFDYLDVCHKPPDSGEDQYKSRC